jgi:antirestriction protein ArdC
LNARVHVNEGFLNSEREKVMATANRTDVYTRVTDRIVSQLEQGLRPWLKPWNAEHIAGRITRPLRHEGTAYKGINILMLWASAEEHGFISPFWLTYRQAQELGGNVSVNESTSGGHFQSP